MVLGPTLNASLLALALWMPLCGQMSLSLKLTRMGVSGFQTMVASANSTTKARTTLVAPQWTIKRRGARCQIYILGLGVIATTAVQEPTKLPSTRSTGSMKM